MFVLKFDYSVDAYHNYLDHNDQFDWDYMVLYHHPSSDVEKHYAAYTSMAMDRNYSPTFLNKVKGYNAKLGERLETNYLLHTDYQRKNEGVQDEEHKVVEKDYKEEDNEVETTIKKHKGFTVTTTTTITMG